jgi:hypothetical protein
MVTFRPFRMAVFHVEHGKMGNFDLLKDELPIVNPT